MNINAAKSLDNAAVRGKVYSIAANALFFACYHTPLGGIDLLHRCEFAMREKATLIKRGRDGACVSCGYIPLYNVDKDGGQWMCSHCEERVCFTCLDALDSCTC